MDQVKHHRERTTAMWAFALSILLTAFAFVAVGLGLIENRVSLFLFLVLLALLQVGFQLFYFMHLKDKGHRFPIIFAASSVFVALILVYGIAKWN